MQSVTPIEAIESIEAACSAFETRVQQGSVEPAEWEEYLHQVDKEHRQELLCELRKLDLYYSWNRARSEESGIPACGKLVEDYGVALADLAETSSLIHLLSTELACRLEAGDQVTVRDYVERFPQLEEPIRIELAAAVCELAPICLQIVIGGMLRFQTFLSGITVFGRQRSSEPPPYTVTQLPEGARFIIAGARQRKFSRKHAVVAPIGSSLIEVTALSQKSDTICAGKRVEPGSTVQAELPVDLYLGPQLVRLTS